MIIMPNKLRMYMITIKISMEIVIINTNIIVMINISTIKIISIIKANMDKLTKISMIIIFRKIRINT